MTPSPPGPAQPPGPARRALLVTLCAVQFIDAYDVAAMGPALPRIQRQLAMSPGALQWVVTAYATEQESQRGIEAFAPVVRDTALAVLKADPDGLTELHTRHPREVLGVRDARRRRVTSPGAFMHSLLHCHFESALRALAVARPGDVEHARAAFESRAYARATPAGRLSLLDRQVARLAQGQDIFTREVFAEVVRRLGEEMTSSGIRHVDLRVGVLMHRWPWVGTPALRRSPL